jgi:hypothetical protein
MMLHVATVAAVVLAAAASGTDTTVQVRKGTRLHLHNFGGSIAVEAWPKSAVHIAAEHSSRVRIVLEETGPDLQVRAVSRRHPSRVDYSLRVPEWLPINLNGIHSDIRVKGSKAEVTAETVHGVVSVEGGEGFIRLSSMNGPIQVIKPRGRIELSAINDVVRVIGAEGEVTVNGVNGDIDLEDVMAELIAVTTVNGTVRFVGDLRKDGRYDFNTHQGDLILGVPEDLDATIKVATFNGEFESVLPVRLEKARHGGRFLFTLGSGSARVNLESFGGSIRLVRVVEALREAKERGREWREAELERQREAAEEAREREMERREEQREREREKERERH